SPMAVSLSERSVYRRLFWESADAVAQIQAQQQGSAGKTYRRLETTDLNQPAGDGRAEELASGKENRHIAESNGNVARCHLVGTGRLDHGESTIDGTADYQKVSEERGQGLREQRHGHGEGDQRQG